MHCEPEAGRDAPAPSLRRPCVEPRTLVAFPKVGLHHDDGWGAIMVVGRDYFLRQAAALLEAAQLTAKSQEAEELTLRAIVLIELVDELSAPDDLGTTPH